MDDGDIAALMKQLGAKDSDRSVAILCGAMVDRVLMDRLISHFRPMDKPNRDRLFTGEGAPLAALSARIKIAFALDIISPTERDELNCIREIRNAFAHSI